MTDVTARLHELRRFRANIMFEGAQGLGCWISITVLIPL